MNDRPLVAYEPNAILARLYKRFFSHIEVDEAWATAVREADRRGTVVYVLRNLSFVDFFALDYLTKRLDLPQVRFANDLGLWILEPMGRGWRHALSVRNEASDAEDLRRTVTEGSSAALFLKRPADITNPAARGRGKIEGDAFIRTIFEVQRRSKKPILLVPQVFVWSKHPDEARHTAFDAMLGSREWPGKIRTVAQFLMNYRDVTLRAGEPVDVQTFLASESASQTDGPPSDDVLVRRMTYTLLRRLERERHAVLGPTKKPADRLREEVVRSPRLQKVIHDMAGEGESERRVLTERALAMVREMEAALDMNAIAAWDAAVHSVLSRIYSGLEVDEDGLARLRAATKDGALILLPSHKSHLDYIFLAHVFYRNHLPVPVVAAGDNLAFFPLGPAFRRAGAFFIRRSFHGDRLYGAVVDAYMRRLILDGWSMEFFLEGGRSRTGKLLTPKVGLLSLVVDAALGAGRKLYFVPVSIGYERVVEEQEYVRELTGGEKKKEDVRGLFAGASLFRQKYGRLNLQIGELLTMDGMLAELDRSPKKAKKAMSLPPISSPSLAGAARAPTHGLTPARRRAMVTHLAYRVMNEINRVTAVTPGSLVAMALLTHGKRGMSDADLIDTCRRLSRTLRGFGARFTPSLTSPHEPDTLRVASLREALALFVRAGHVTMRLPGAAGLATVPSLKPAEDAVYRVPDEARLSLDLSKNIVVHFFIARALVAAAILAARTERRGDRGMPEEAVQERVQTLSRLFKHEFLFRAEGTFEENFRETLSGMVDAGELVHRDGMVSVGQGEPALSVTLYAELVRSFLESYRIAARGLSLLLRGPLALKDVAKRCIAMGERMFLQEEVLRCEAVSRPVIENAFAAFIDEGYLVRTEGKLALAESYATAGAVKTIESRIALYLPKPS